MNDIWKKLSAPKISYMVSGSMLEHRLKCRRMRKSLIDRGIVKFEREGNDICVYINDCLVISKWLSVTDKSIWNERVRAMFDTMLAIKKM